MAPCYQKREHPSFLYPTMPHPLALIVPVRSILSPTLDFLLVSTTQFIRDYTARHTQYAILYSTLSVDLKVLNGVSVLVLDGPAPTHSIPAPTDTHLIPLSKWRAFNAGRYSPSIFLLAHYGFCLLSFSLRGCTGAEMGTPDQTELTRAVILLLRAAGVESCGV